MVKFVNMTLPLGHGRATRHPGINGAACNVKEAKQVVPPVENGKRNKELSKLWKLVSY